MTQAQPHISSRTTDGVLTIVFDRPKKKNAFTRAMYERLVELLDEASAAADVRAVLMHGTEGCFTAGNDLMDFMQAPPSDTDSPVFQLLLRLHRFEKPLLAAVQGPAVGLGTTMLLHCDLVFAAPSAAFRLPFVDLGLCPEGASTFLLPRMMGHQAASALLMLGDKFGAEEARRLGLVNEVIDEEQVVAHATGIAVRLAKKPPSSLRLTKSLLKQAIHERSGDALYREAEEFLARLTSEEAREAFSAFFEKRPPDFSRFS